MSAVPTSLAVSSTGNTVAVGDAAGNINILRNSTVTGNIPTFNVSSFQPPLPHDYYNHVLPHIDIHNIHDSVSFVPMPYSEDPLLSDWNTG